MRQIERWNRTEGQDMRQSQHVECGSKVKQAREKGET